MTLSDREAQRADAMAAEVDRFIEHRSRQLGAQEGGRALEWTWAEREREDAEDRAELRKALWAKHHARMERVHATLAQQHRQRLERLTSSTAKPGRNVSDV